MEALGERAYDPTSPLVHLARALSGAFAFVRDLNRIEPRSALPALALALVLAALWALQRRRNRELLTFTLLPVASYLIAMVVVASRVHFDPIDNSRFWVPVWPLATLAALGVIANARGRLQ